MTDTREALLRAANKLVRDTAMSLPPSDFGSHRAIVAMARAMVDAGWRRPRPQAAPVDAEVLERAREIVGRWHIGVSRGGHAGLVSDVARALLAGYAARAAAERERDRLEITATMLSGRLSAAEGAVARLTEPTDDMKLAGARALRDNVRDDNQWRRAGEVWEAMYRAALAPAAPEAAMPATKECTCGGRLTPWHRLGCPAAPEVPDGR